jgi:hypothetical protein
MVMLRRAVHGNGSQHVLRNVAYQIGRDIPDRLLFGRSASGALGAFQHQSHFLMLFKPHGLQRVKDAALVNGPKAL